MNSKKWKRYEDLVARIQRSLVSNPTAKVRQDEKILGKDSKTLRQLDITVRERVGQFELLCVVECKDHKSPIDVEELGAFISKLNDVQAHKGAMVAAKGFTKAAVEMARANDVDMLTALDAEDHDWKTLVRMPMLVTDLGLSYSLEISCSAPVPISLPEPLTRLVLYRRNGMVIDSVHNLVMDRWENEGQELEAGETRQFPIANEEVFINSMGVIVPVTMSVYITAIPRTFYGHVPLPAISGFQDIAKGTFSGKLQTGPLSFSEIEKTWKELSPGEPPPSPVLMQIHVSSTYPRMSLEGNPIESEGEGLEGLPRIDLLAGTTAPFETKPDELS